MHPKHRSKVFQWYTEGKCVEMENKGALLSNVTLDYSFIVALQFCSS